jgi:hypothetical protein
VNVLAFKLRRELGHLDREKPYGSVSESTTMPERTPVMSIPMRISIGPWYPRSLGMRSVVQKGNPTGGAVGFVFGSIRQAATCGVPASGEKLCSRGKQRLERGFRMGVDERS